MTDKSKVPLIRFKGFSEGWEEGELLDYSLRIGDGLHGTPSYVDDSGIYFINGNNLIFGLIHITNETKQVSKKDYTKNDKVLDFNTILMSINGTIGNIAWYQGEKVMLGKSVAYIILNNCDNAYMYFYLQSTSVNRYFLNNLTGSTIKNLGLKTIRETKVLIPKKRDEQTKIGNYFQNLDKLIEQKEKKYQKLKQFKKAMLEKMFPKDGEDSPEIRFKGFSGEWDNEKLEKLADFSKGQGYSKSDLVDFGTSIVLYGRLYTKYQTVISKVDTFVLKNDNSIFSKGNEVVVPSSGETAEDIARASAITVKDIILGGDLNIVYPNDKINNVFLALNISYGKTQKDLSKRAQGKSVVHLRNNDLKEVNLSYPDITEQTKIGNYFQKLDKFIDLQQKEIKKLKNIKKASLEKMFV